MIMTVRLLIIVADSTASKPETLTESERKGERRGPKITKLWEEGEVELMGPECMQMERKRGRDVSSFTCVLGDLKTESLQYSNFG